MDSLDVPDSIQSAGTKGMLSAKKFALLLRQLSVISLVAMLITSGILIFLYRQDQLAEHVKISSQENELAANHLMRSLDDQIYTLITSSNGLDTQALRANPNIDLFPPAQEMAREYGILKLKIYNRSGTTLYSSAKSEIGETGRHPDMLAKALRGEVSDSHEFREMFLSANGEMHGVHISLTYMPLVHAGERIGAIEIYRDLNPLFERLKAKTIRIALSVFYVITALYAALFFYIRRTDRAVAEWQKRLMGSEARYRAVAQSANDAIITADSAGNIASCNKSVETIFGYTEAELLGQPLTVLMPQRFQDRHLEGMKRVLSGGEQHVIGKAVELMGRRKDASEFPLELSLAQWAVGGQQFFTGFIRDITERETANAKIQRRTQIFAALSQCNKAIVHCSNAEELFQEVCRTVVQLGGMRMAWIGIIDAETHMVRSVASFGDDIGYLQNIEISTDSISPFGRGPTGIAIRENRPFWCQDFINDPVTAPWHEPGALSGWGSAAAIPLQRNGAVIGALTLYAGEINAFDEAARELLIEVSADISFAIDNFDHEALRRKAEQSLANMATKYRTLFETSSDAITLFDGKSFIDCNDAALMIFDCPTRDDFIHKHPAELSPPTQPGGEDSLSLAKHYIATAFKSGSKRFEWMHRRLDGTDFPTEVLLTALELDGKPMLQSTIRDITERRRMDEMLKNIATKYRTVFELSADAMMLVDENGFIDCNEATLRMFGCPTLDDFIGKRPADFSPAFQPGGETSMSLAGKHFAATVKKGSHQFEWSHLHSNGSEFPVEVLVTAMQVGGKPVLHCVVRDITERKRTEMALLDSREKLQNLLDSMAEGAYGVDTNGHCTFVNRAFLQILGYESEAEILGKHIHELIHHSHVDGTPYPASECKMYRAYQTLQTVNVSDEVFWRKDGVAIPVEYWSHPIVTDGGGDRCGSHLYRHHRAQASGT